MASDLVIPSQIVFEIKEVYPEREEKDIIEELTNRVRFISQVYSSGSRHHMWTDIERFALSIIRNNHVMDEEVYFRAVSDVKLCEIAYDRKDPAWKNALKALDTHLYNVLMTRSKLGYQAKVKVMMAGSAPETMGGLLTKFAKASELDERTFGDRVLQQIWGRLAREDTTRVMAMMSRIKQIINNECRRESAEPQS